jgi:uncharacterized hydrophobic protein (TIGR00271 family)
MQKPLHALSYSEKQQIYAAIVDGSEPKLSFYILVILSTVIAAYGLIANSTAVVIGAMIVAPLMTPIIGIALSLVSSDSQLFRHALIAEIVGVLCSVTLGFMAGKFTFGVELSSEILARTQPLPYDILVALAAGLAGAYSLVNPKINAALAGVAIAVSLVPPLAATGICLALARYDLAMNAFLLFFANFLAIQFAAVLIFISSGFVDYFHYQENEQLIKHPVSKLKVMLIFSRRFLLNFILLIGITWHLSETLIELVNKKQFQRELESVVKEEVKTRTGARLTELNYKKEADGKINAIAVVMTPQEFSAADVTKIQQHLQTHFTMPINLIIRSIISKDADVTGTIFLLDEEKLKRQRQSEKSSFLNEMTQLLKSALGNIPGAYLEEVRREDDDGITNVIAIIRTPVAIKPSQVQVMELILQTVDKNIRLVVRSILTRDADAARYLYDTGEGSITDRLSDEELALHKKLESVLKQAIKKIVKGGVLLDFQYTAADEMIEVLAVIQTPNNFSNRQVKLIQARLKKEVDNRVKLIVRSVVGTDMDENGFVSPDDEAESSGVSAASP